MQASSTQFNSSNATQGNRPAMQQSPFGQGQLEPVDDLIEYVTSYARQNPGTAALWCFGIGFILGWRLKPW